MTPLLAYIDVRPFLFVAGLPILIGVVLLLCRWRKVRRPWWLVAVASSAAYSLLFVLFLTGYGPFVDQKEQREFSMRWEILPEPSRSRKQAEVVLSFVEFPNHRIGIFSDVLAIHLQQLQEQPVRVVFSVTSDYGRVRGFSQVEVAGRRGLVSEWGYYSVEGLTNPSPFD